MSTLVRGMGIVNLKAAAPPTTATWDPAHVSDGSISSAIDLSNGNLTAQITAGAVSNNPGGRSTIGRTSGKIYWEIHADAILGGGGSGTGVINETGDVNNFIMGANLNSIGVDRDGNVTINSVIVATTTGWLVGDTRSYAFDATAKLFWVRVNAGNWNANPSADPASGALGIDTSSVTGTFYVGFSLSGAVGGQNILTGNFGASAYSQSVPSGFGNW